MFVNFQLFIVHYTHTKTFITKGKPTEKYDNEQTFLTVINQP